MADRSGQQVDNYRLIRCVGGGGFGDVYLAEDIFSKKQVAIKMLRGCEKSLDQFLREVRIALLPGARDAHIVPAIDCNKEQSTGVLYLVMEYMPGGTLRHRYRQGKRLFLPTIVSYVKQIATALDFAHNYGFVHRDVKPENMLVDQKNMIMLCDFGIATTSSTVDSNIQHDAIGTWVYMAPEQMQKEPVRESDQYALGIIVYEWLAGYPPFWGHTWQELAVKHVSVPPPSLRQKFPDVSQEIEAVVMRALEKEPKKRFPSIKAFADALERASGSVLGKTFFIFDEHVGIITSLAWSSDGTCIASASSDGIVHIWEVSTGKLLSSYVGHTGKVESVAWSSDGTYIASSDSSGMIHIWQAATSNTLITYPAHTGGVHAIAWMPDGTRLASAGGDKAVHIWQATTDRRLSSFRNHVSEVECVAWSPNGKYIASGGYDATVQVQEVITGKWLAMYRRHTGCVYSLAWSPDSAHIASAGFDGTVQVWEVHTGQTVLAYRGHTDIVFAISWSSQWPYIASGGDDQNVQIWHITTGERIFTYDGHTSGIRAIAWSPDGTCIASGGLDKTIRIWQAVR